MKNLHSKRTSTVSNLGWLIPQQMSIRIKKVGGRRFVESCIRLSFRSPCPPECYLQSETKIEPDLRLNFWAAVAIAAFEMYG